MDFHLVDGDATQPIGDGPKIIVHSCNDIGRWGKGFVLPLGEAYPAAKQRYKHWYKHRSNDDPPFALGSVQFVPVDEQLWVANLIGQHDIIAYNSIPPVRYDAIAHGLITVCDFATQHHASVHMPRIGTGLGLGQWTKISPLIYSHLTLRGVEVYVYNYTGEDVAA